MTNHELLDMIGEVGEDYVLAAGGDNAVKPRFRWGTLAACAACAALILAAYPAYRMSRPQSRDSISSLEDAPEAGQAPVQRPGLHEYTLVEGDEVRAITTEGDAKLPEKGGAAPGQGAPLPEPAQPPRGDGPVAAGGAYVDGDAGAEDINGFDYSAPTPDAAAQAAAEWYDALLRTYRLEEHPEWYGGAWIAGDELLAVAIVDGFRTPELEAEIKEAAGAGAVLQFSTAKYSMEFLYGLMEPATRALDGTGLACGIGVDVVSNCLGVDLYGDEAAIPDSVLAALAHLDPDGDAIRVRVFTQAMSTLTDEVKKGPAPAAVSTPVPAGAREVPAEEPACTEAGQPAIYDLPEPKQTAEPTCEPAERLPDVIEGPDE